MNKQRLQLIAIILIFVSICLKLIGGAQWLAPISGLINMSALVTAIIAVGLAFWLVLKNSKY